MARFKFTTMALDGSCSTSEREVEDADILSQELKRQGLILVSIEAAKAKTGFGKRTVSPRSVTAFLKELSLILRSGLPLVEALDLAAEDLEPALADAVRSLQRELVAGASFVQALDQQHKIFTPDVVAMARVAEAQTYIA
jgi:type II secretory pathway component PulF